MDELEMRQVVAHVAAAVRLLRGLDGVQRVADGAVADRVHVHLEVARVEECDDALEVLGRDHRDPVVVGADVGLEQGAGEVLEHAVREDLRPADPQAADRAGRAELDEVLELLVAALAVPEEVPLDAHGQLAALGERAVGGERLRLDPRVLPGGDPERVVLLLRAEDRPLPLLVGGGRQQLHDDGHRVLVQRPLRLAGLEALDPPARWVGRLARDAGGRERDRVHPGAVAVAVVEERRPVGNDGVQVGPARRPALEGVDRPAAADDPVELGVLGGVAGDRSRGTPRASRFRAGRTAARRGRPRPGVGGRPGSRGAPCAPRARRRASPGRSEPRLRRPARPRRCARRGRRRPRRPWTPCRP